MDFKRCTWSMHIKISMIKWKIKSHQQNLGIGNKIIQFCLYSQWNGTESKWPKIGVFGLERRNIDGSSNSKKIVLSVVWFIRSTCHRYLNGSDELSTNCSGYIDVRTHTTIVSLKFGPLLSSWTCSSMNSVRAARHFTDRIRFKNKKWRTCFGWTKRSNTIFDTDVLGSTSILFLFSFDYGSDGSACADVIFTLKIYIRLVAKPEPYTSKFEFFDRLSTSVSSVIQSVQFCRRLNSNKHWIEKQITKKKEKKNNCRENQKRTLPPGPHSICDSENSSA